MFFQRKRVAALFLLGVIISLAAVVIGPTTVGAHAPQKVLLAYDEATKTLSVTITHTYFSTGHYIEKIEIKKNGKVITGQEYKSQPAETFTYTYKIDAISGDTLEVKASCNRFGSAVEMLAVGKTPAKAVK